MKKILGIVVLNLLFTNVSYSKISKVYYEELYDSCMIEALKANVGYMITKNYCKCTVKKLSERFSDDDLDAVFKQKPEEIIEDTKFASEFCEKKIL